MENKIPKAYRNRKKPYIAGYLKGFELQEGETKLSDVGAKVSVSYLAGFLDGFEDKFSKRKSKFCKQQ